LGASSVPEKRIRLDRGSNRFGPDAVSICRFVLAICNQPKTQGIRVMKSKLLGLLTASAALLASAAGPAQADNLRTSFTTVPQAWLGGAVQNVRLIDSGATSFGFTNPLTGFVAVTYTAECELIASSFSWIAITVLIDGTTVIPSGSDAAFCSGRGTGVGGGWSRNSITVVRGLAAGNHTVAVRAQVFGTHTGARLDDTTILVAR
jgi:hypothetical protein